LGGVSSALLDRERIVAALGLVLVTALAWGYLARMPMDGPASSSLAAWWAALGMWAVMMTAMMLPTAAPMVLTFATVSVRQSAGRPRLATALFVGGYLLSWGVFDAAAAAVQIGISPDPCARLVDANPRLAGALLVVAGVYQLTPVKSACLRGCQSPLGFLLTHWRGGSLGPLRMGVLHGALCIGCCWALMGLMLVVGTMSLFWMAGLTVLILAEKLAVGLPWLWRGAGGILVAAGTFLFVA
jgi:predicted metal-binding membrane protein